MRRYTERQARQQLFSMTRQRSPALEADTLLIEPSSGSNQSIIHPINHPITKTLTSIANSGYIRQNGVSYLTEKLDDVVDGFRKKVISLTANAAATSGMICCLMILFLFI